MYISTVFNYSFSWEGRGGQISTLFSLWCPLTSFPHFEQAGVFLFLVCTAELDIELDWQLASRVSCSSAVE